jgi:hypothetical protein
MGEAPFDMPVTYCSDPEVQAFIVFEAAAWSPYSPPGKHKRTALEIFEEARVKFGDDRCLDLTIPVH